MADDVKLLTAEEIAVLKQAWKGERLSSTLEPRLLARIVATLEALVTLAHERLEALLATEEDRDAWKAEAAEWKATADEWARAFEEEMR